MLGPFALNVGVYEGSIISEVPLPHAERSERGIVCIENLLGVYYAVSLGVDMSSLKTVQICPHAPRALETLSTCRPWCS